MLARGFGVESESASVIWKYMPPSTLSSPRPRSLRRSRDWPRQLGVALIVIAAQEEQLAAERLVLTRARPANSKAVLGPSQYAPSLGIEIAVPDQKAVADVEVLTARRQVERILAQGFGQSAPERQPP